MTIRHQCDCGASIRIPDEFAGRTASCPTCKSRFQISAESPRSRQAAAVGQSIGHDDLGFDAKEFESAAEPLRPTHPASAGPVAIQPSNGHAQPNWGASTAPGLNPVRSANPSAANPSAANPSAANPSAAMPLSKKEILASVFCLLHAAFALLALTTLVFTIGQLFSEPSLMSFVMTVLELLAALASAAVCACGAGLLARQAWAKKAGLWAGIVSLAFTLLTVLIGFVAYIQIVNQLSESSARSAETNAVLPAVMAGSMAMMTISTIIGVVIRGAGPCLMISLFFDERRVQNRISDRTGRN